MRTMKALTNLYSNKLTFLTLLDLLVFYNPLEMQLNHLTIYHLPQYQSQSKKSLKIKSLN